MDINATLIGQLLTFAVLVWFTLKYVWPPITGAMQERARKIADGLQAAEKAEQDLRSAEHQVLDLLKDARKQAAHIVEQANHRAAQILDEGREEAQVEGQRIIKRAHDEIASEVAQTREVLRQQLAELAVAGAGKILHRELNAAAQADLLNEFVAEI